MAGCARRYTAAISHDFNTPIAVLHMLLERLERNAEVVACVGPQLLRPMHVALELLSAIRTKAIDIHKLDHGGQLQPEKSACSLLRLLNDVETMADDSKRSRGLNVARRPHPPRSGEYARRTRDHVAPRCRARPVSCAARPTRAGSLCPRLSAAEGERVHRV